MASVHPLLLYLSGVPLVPPVAYGPLKGLQMAAQVTCIVDLLVKTNE